MELRMIETIAPITYYDIDRIRDELTKAGPADVHTLSEQLEKMEIQMYQFRMQLP